MKKFILTTATILFIGLSAFAQDFSYSKKDEIKNISGSGNSGDLYFEVKGMYTRPVTKERLDNAKVLNDFISGYPVNWITGYNSVEILATCNGKTMRAVSANDILSTEQKNILNTVDPGTGIIINVMYKSKNAATDEMVDMTMNVSMMIVPEKEAEYTGGEQQMKKYLKENVINKISETMRRQLGEAVAKVMFTVSEKGEIVNAKILMSSEDPETDKLLIDAINKMPTWKPSESSNGIKVKQEFEFYIGNGGC